MTHSPSFQLISPVDGEVLLHRSWASAEQIDAALEAAQRSQLHWSALSLSDRSSASMPGDRLLLRPATPRWS